jgi:hypothetical protein
MAKYSRHQWSAQTETNTRAQSRNRCKFALVVATNGLLIRRSVVRAHFGEPSFCKTLMQRHFS